MAHDDACRCQTCCAEKFKTIDSARFGQAPGPPRDPAFLARRLAIWSATERDHETAALLLEAGQAIERLLAGGN